MFSREKDFLMARNLFATRPQIEVGAMIETPRAVDNARWIANRANWLSIGLRDLTERTLGLNPRATGAAVVLDSCDPSVIRMVSAVVRAAEQASQEKGVVVPVSFCGVRAVESQDKDSHDAAIIDAETFILLIGLGVQDFSLDPRIAGNANYILSKVDFSRAKTLADKILQMPGGMPSKVRAMVRDSFPEAFS